MNLAPTLPAQAPLGPFGPNAVVWPTSAGGNGHAYEAVTVPGGVPWTSAFDAALAAGGYLATITSAAESDMVANLVRFDSGLWLAFLGNSVGPWIGGRQSTGSAEPSAGWGWCVGGEPFVWTNWQVGQPSNNYFGSEEDFLQLFLSPSPATFPVATTSVRWNDYPESAGTVLPRSYIVEYDLDLLCPCTPTGVGATNAPPNDACAGFTLCAAHAASGAARLQLFNVPAGAAYGKILMSAAPMPVGSVGVGPVFGLNFDGLLGAILFLPYLPGDPLSFLFTEAGVFPQSTYVFPPGTMSAFAGTAWDLVAGVVVPTGPAAGLQLSNAVQNVW